MTFDFTCHSCDSTFEVDLADLLEDSQVECPTCESRAPRSAVEGVTTALEELFTQLAALRRKFTVLFEVDSGDPPSPYDREGQRASGGAAEDDEEVEDDEELEDEDAEEIEPEDDR